ncbi:MAG: hypothetical protein P8N28_05710 [Phycisphaerales bacterium]|nr:hypothetical protein [Phycisphaerales bacterium]|tara:strand:+ start:5230 stop:5439 length:210 start_codon:yes stop_codon:yes gene_type:complete
MYKVCDQLGGMWVALTLFIRCKGRTGKGSYLAWRKETAFGKDGEFTTLSKQQKRKDVRAWSRWAWRSRR